MQFFRPDYLLKQENICEQTRHFKVGKWSLKIEKPLSTFIVDQTLSVTMATMTLFAGHIKPLRPS